MSVNFTDDYGFSSEHPEFNQYIRRNPSIWSTVHNWIKQTSTWIDCLRRRHKLRLIISQFLTSKTDAQQISALSLAYGIHAQKSKGLRIEADVNLHYVRDFLESLQKVISYNKSIPTAAPESLRISYALQWRQDLGLNWNELPKSIFTSEMPTYKSQSCCSLLTFTEQNKRSKI